MVKHKRLNAVETQEIFEDSQVNKTCGSSMEGKFIPSAEFVPRSKYLTAMVDGDYWSYIVNNKGNAIRMTLDGYGSCTPANVLQRWIDELSVKKQRGLAIRCGKIKDYVNRT